MNKQKIQWKNFGRIMVFIDAANIIYSLRSLGWKMDYKKLYNFFSRETRLQAIYFYTSIRKNNKKDQRWINLLRRFGYIARIRFVKLIRKTNGAVEAKGNLDGYVFVDALDRIEKYDTCVLLSGDSDFDILIDYLHKKNKQVVVCSTRKHCAWELRQSADKYISLQYFRNIAEYKNRNKKTNPENSGRLDFSSRETRERNPILK